MVKFRDNFDYWKKQIKVFVSVVEEKDAFYLKLSQQPLGNDFLF